MRRLLTIVIFLSLTGCATTTYRGSEMYRAFDAFDRAKKIKYVKDEFEYWQTPLETASFKQGDCEDLSIYLQRMLIDRGLQSWIIFGALNNGDEELHVWNEVSIFGAHYVMDVSNGVFGKKETLCKKFPNSYIGVILSEDEEHTFEVHKKFLLLRLRQGKEKADILRGMVR